MVSKMIAWYVVGSVLWFFIFGFIMATSLLRAQIIVSFATLTAGLFVGLLMKAQFIKRPWLLVFVPILHLVAGIF